MSDPSSLLNAQLELFRDIQITRYSQSEHNIVVAAGSIIVFDHLLTFDDEVNLIWVGPWSLAKALFLTVSMILFSVLAKFTLPIIFQSRYYVLAAMIVLYDLRAGHRSTRRGYKPVKYYLVRP
ncbi:hypothetical protein GALMADRAFT_217138 [Galerina marginata CBS 339.88]|uniref:DUF6533 domain-containing protein n=1 Tax=Galerina marginata (strain CBS 339.88) TaxID=685588 RepID=A0A067S8N1_GALM3|nr:hypothetical protein GALMADRAFT_217138 [Galerina marginata CBS 339.88]